MIFILGEGVLIYFAVTLASFIILGKDMGMQGLLQKNWWSILLVTTLTQISLYFNDLYEIKKNENIIELATLLIQSIGIAAIILAIIYFILPDAIIGRWIFFVSIIFLFLFLISWRSLYALTIKKRLLTEKTIILGYGELVGDILHEIKNRKDIIYDIRHIVLHQNERGSSTKFDSVPIRYGFYGICDLADTEQVSSIIVALSQKRGVMPYEELLSCKTKGVSIIDGESFYERITGKLMVEKINPSWLIFSDGFGISKTSRIVKRIYDLVLSLIMLMTISPVLALVAVAIKLNSRGPVFFSQERIGENGKPFTLYKFRSMKAGAEEGSGPVWASHDDPRITEVGKIIRKLRIDELPQLWNVLKGDLSFVGPRPERPFFVEKLKQEVPYYKERHIVKPGITGWAQINYGYGASIEDALEKLKYDLYYIKNMSLFIDLMVIFHTAKIVLLGRGSR